MRSGVGLGLLDPHGDLINHLLRCVPSHRLQDVVLLDVLDGEYSFGLNVYECSNPADPDLVVQTTSQVMNVFKKIWGPGSSEPSWGPLMEDLLRNVSLTLIQNQGYTMCEVPKLLLDEGFRARLLTNVTNPEVRRFWMDEYNPMRPLDQREYIRSTLNKVRAFLTNPIVRTIVGQSTTTIDFRQLMDRGKILLVKLAARYDDVTSLLGSMMIGQLLNAALTRADVSEHSRRPFHLYADEYHRFATPDFATLLAEARKFGVATTIAHQFRDQLDRVNQGATLNVANMMVFKVSGKDASDLAGEFDCTPPPPDAVGYRPRLATSPDPVKHLLINGHEHEDVRLFISEYLLVIANTERQMSEPFISVVDHETRISRYSYSRSDLQYAISLINTLFVNIMEGRTDIPMDGQKVPLVLIESVKIGLVLRGYLRFHERGVVWFSEGKQGMMDSPFNEAILKDLILYVLLMYGSSTPSEEVNTIIDEKLLKHK